MSYDFEIQDIRKLCGYVEDGSHTTVILSQDDATRDWVVQVGKKSYYGKSMGEAMQAALRGEGIK